VIPLPEEPFLHDGDMPPFPAVNRPSRTRVLVVDDEASIRELLEDVLTDQDWEVRGAGTGTAAIAQALAFRPDVIVLDIVLPDIDGLEVLDRIRSALPATRVLFLTANDSVEDRIAGITAGGDDYVTKPFSVEEVVARLRGLLRRVDWGAVPDESMMQVGDLQLIVESHEVRRGDTEVKLTAREFELLTYLMENTGIVLSKERILDEVWQYDFGHESNIVELYISYLRKKIDSGRSPMIHTIRRVGYVLKASDE